MERWAERLGTELRLRLQLAVLLARDRGGRSADLVDLLRALGVPAAEVEPRMRELVRAAGPLSGSARWLDRVGPEVRELLARAAAGARPGEAVEVAQVAAELELGSQGGAPDADRTRRVDARPDPETGPGG